MNVGHLIASGPITPGELSVLNGLISTIRLVGPPPTPSPTPPPPSMIPAVMKVGANGALQTQAMGILQYQCADKGIRYDTDVATMRTVAAGNDNGSRMYTECRDRLMPEFPFQPLNANEPTAIQTWIADGAANN